MATATDSGVDTSNESNEGDGEGSMSYFTDIVEGERKGSEIVRIIDNNVINKEPVVDDSEKDRTKNLEDPTPPPPPTSPNCTESLGDSAAESEGMQVEENVCPLEVSSEWEEKDRVEECEHKLIKSRQGVNLNDCVGFIKFECPQIAHYFSKAVDRPTNEINSIIGIHQFQNSARDYININSLGIRNNCQALIPYQQKELNPIMRPNLKFAVTCPTVNKHKKHFYELRLRVAAYNGNVCSVIKLLNDSVDPNAADHWGRTSLHLASSAGQGEVVRHLLQAGADPNKRDINGNTPLHLAACTNHFEVVTCLLRAGTDVSQVDNSGRNPLQLAQSKLKILANIKCDSSASVRVKTEVQQIIEMMLEYLQKSGSAKEAEAELLNSFASKLTLSQTPEEVDADLKCLLNNLSSLQIGSISQGSSTSNMTGPFQNTELSHKPEVKQCAGSHLPSSSRPLIAPPVFNFKKTVLQEQKELIKSLKDRHTTNS